MAHDGDEKLLLKLLKSQKKNIELGELVAKLNENVSALSEQLRKNAQESQITYEIHGEEVKSLKVRYVF
jgi:vacuolar-type H+-ATPase subunit E/Vma4